ncbi:MAG TPA: precorrin-3B C(17)-methyltransferase [Acidimicrobiales bacterium]|nr:precorrin-3B C(17)-methyltransferase [Acidimicrobiales bacterium]
MSVLSVSVTERGRELAGRLPYPHRHGDVAATVRRRWSDVDGFVLFLATGAAVRIVAPLLADKASDPAVVCVDDSGSHAVALCGGHAGGANALAREVAALLGALPVITTATDALGVPPLDALPGFLVRGDTAGVTTALLDGRPVELHNPLGWPLPPALADLLGRPGAPGGAAAARVVVTDEAAVPAPPLGDHRQPTALLHPPSLVVGAGTASDAPEEELVCLVLDSLDGHGLARDSVAAIATIDRRVDHPALRALARALGRSVQGYASSALAGVAVPSPSPAVADAVGTPSVAEAAALLAAGSGSRLLVPKRRSASATVAVARRAGPPGQVAVVGLGPGAAAHRTPAAAAAVSAAEVVIGYAPYVDLAGDLLGPAQEVVRSPIGDEQVRAKQALSEAASGRRVAVVCSGDPGVYAMASLVLELAPQVAPGVEVSVLPGVTAALAAAALLGAPLGHDHAAISLSDLHTPWAVIERRLRAVAEADLAVTLYNPRSRARPWQLESARRLLLTHRPPSTPVGVVTDAGRAGQRVSITTLADFAADEVGMTTCVVIGASTTAVVGGRMVTPRGYGS